MSIDLRLRHDRSTRERAAEMFERGLGYRSVAKVLGVPAEAVRDWLGKYRATGRDGLLAMDGRRARYDFETKVAAARAQGTSVQLCRIGLALDDFHDEPMGEADDLLADVLDGVVLDADLVAAVRPLDLNGSA